MPRFILNLHTLPSRLTLQNTLTPSRLNFAKNSSKHENLEDLAWPWYLQYLGYASIAATPFVGFITGCIERRDFREIFEGDYANGVPSIFGSYGEKSVGYVRDWWTEGKGFSDEDFNSMKMRRERIMYDNEKKDVNVRVNDGEGMIKLMKDQIADYAAVSEAGNKIGLSGDGIKKLEILDESEAEDGGGVKYRKPDVNELFGIERLESLTHTFSTWQYQSPLSGNKAGGVGGAVNNNGKANPSSNSSSTTADTTSSSTQEEDLVNPSKASQLKYLYAKLDTLEATQKDSNNTRDMDDIQNEIDQTRVLIRKVRGGLLSRLFG